LWIRKAQQTIFVNGIGGALARGAADLVIFPFTLIKARLEVGLDFVRIEKKEN
jgi:hypothetical protein